MKHLFDATVALFRAYILRRPSTERAIVAITDALDALEESRKAHHAAGVRYSDKCKTYQSLMTREVAEARRAGRIHERLSEIVAD